MNFQESVKTCLTKYIYFNGRANLPEFWWFFLFTFVATAVLSYLSVTLNLLFSLAVLLPSLAVGARRLRDSGRNPLWLLAGLIPVLGWLLLLFFFVQPSKAA